MPGGVKIVYKKVKNMRNTSKMCISKEASLLICTFLACLVSFDAKLSPCSRGQVTKNLRFLSWTFRWKKLKSDFLQILCLSLVFKTLQSPFEIFPTVGPSLCYFSPPLCGGIYLHYSPAQAAMWSLEKFNDLYRPQTNYSRVIRQEKSQWQTHP